MKKTSLLLVILLISILIATGCGQSTNNNKEESSTNISDNIENKEPQEISVYMPNGTPAISMSQMAKENKKIGENYNINYKIENTSDNLVTEVLKGTPDIAIVPSNLAAQVYNKELGYVLAGTTGWGALYLISTDEELEVKDLSGKEVFNIAKGLTPDLIFREILNANGLGEEQVTLSYVGGPTELAPYIVSGKANLAVVPEPSLTVIKGKKSELKVLANLNEEWAKSFQMERGFPQASIIIKKDLVENHKSFVDEFIKKLDESIDWVNENAAKAAEYSGEIGVSFEAPIIEKSIENSNLDFVHAQETKKEYDKYYEVLMNSNEKSIGGKMPDEKFFLEK